jgi:ubiquinone/menaquinone biosynthesis C-methylase UbiE
MSPISNLPAHKTEPPPHGAILHAARAYDLLAWLWTLGRERALRERMLSFVQLQTGESVLDVGCGTGTLAIAAKQQVGAAGIVHGVDASPQMLARAARKAARRRCQVAFVQGPAQALPFPDARFDVVLSTLMLHHLPRSERRQCVAEMGRVLKPGGRVLIADFGQTDPRRRGLLAHFHRHGHTKPEDVTAMIDSAGLRALEQGIFGEQQLHFVLATTGHREQSVGAARALR